MNPKTGPRMWKNVYGFDTVKLIPGYQSIADVSPIYKECMKAEYSKFAQDCTRNGGFFKCCMIGY